MLNLEIYHIAMTCSASTEMQITFQKKLFFAFFDYLGPKSQTDFIYIDKQAKK